MSNSDRSADHSDDADRSADRSDDADLRDDPPTADLPDDARRRIERFVRNWLADENLPGASVAVVRGDDLAYAEGFGSRDLADNRPATGDTLYGVGSVTKSVAALAVMQLAESGDLEVDDPATDYLDIDHPEDVTFHHLLTHSSGLPSLGTSEALIARQAGFAELGVPLGDRADFHAHVEGGLGERAADPGERFFYCNSGYSLLGEVVENVTGRPFDEYVETEILDPLGMDRSTFSADAYGDDDDSATPYRLRNDDAPEPTDLPVREVSAAPGGLLSSVHELARWVACHRNRGELDGTRLAGEDAFDRMHAGHVETDAGPYGYGWRRREIAQETVVGHSGSIAVSTAYAGFTPDDEWGVAVCCNAAPGYALRAVGEAILAALLGGNPADAPVFARRERLDELTGTYESYRGIRTASVSTDGETLRLEFEDAFGGEGSPLIPADDALETADDTLETADDATETTEFYELSPEGERRTVTFDASGDGTDLYYDRWRLRKVE